MALRCRHKKRLYGEGSGGGGEDGFEVGREGGGAEGLGRQAYPLYMASTKKNKGHRTIGDSLKRLIQSNNAGCSSSSRVPFLNLIQLGEKAWQ